MSALLEAARVVLALAFYAIVPTTVPAVRKLLAAARAPGSDTELAGLPAALAAFNEAAS